ncbi:ATP-binding protein [Desulfolutivibrio sp.]|uniref:ATP-binding protein n=1 Tax=Desulfolutivibrio sp. TaxID=2773296 RepID=UPI002F962574
MAYASHIDQGGLHVVFTAKARNIDRAVAEIEDFVSRNGAWPLFDIKLIVREALLNATLHGGAGHGSHEVSCTVRLVDDAVECTVSDPGPGFDWRARRGRIPPLDAESGRGVCIMEAYADMMEYNAAGNVLRLVKKRGGESCGTPRCQDEAGKTK